jgi:hypothetical protein
VLGGWKAVAIAASALLAAVAVPGASAGASATASGPSAPSTIVCGQWNVVPSPNRGSHGSSLGGVAAVSSTDAWAVGNSYNGSIYKTLAERWNGATWSIVATANVGTRTNSLNAVDVVSASDVWAVGFYDDGTTFRTLAQHWNGSKWKVIPTPNAGTGENVFMSVDALATNDVWAVGFQEATPGQPRRTLAEHWDGHVWTIEPTIDVGTDENFLWDVTVRATDDVWAVGSYSVPWFQTLVEHWDGHDWTVVSSPNQGDGNNVLYAAVAFSPTNVMAVGTWLNGDQTASLAQQWNGADWSVVPSPSPGAQLDWLNGASATSKKDIWAVGFRIDAPFQAKRTLTMHWNGRAWKVFQSMNVGTEGSVLMSSSSLAGTSDVWAVGSYQSGGVDQTLVEFRC